MLSFKHFTNRLVIITIAITPQRFSGHAKFGNFRRSREKFLNFRMSRVVRGSQRSGEACAARACPKNVVQDAKRSGVSWTTLSAAAAPQRKSLQVQLPSINSSFPQKQITIVGLSVCTLLGVCFSLLTRRTYPTNISISTCAVGILLFSSH